jgi:hypothetical protein
VQQFAAKRIAVSGSEAVRGRVRSSDMQLSGYARGSVRLSSGVARSVRPSGSEHIFK